MPKINLANVSEFFPDMVAETEKLQNLVIKYDRFEGEIFKIGFIGKRTNPGPFEPVFYPVWVATVSAVTVARQMFGNELVEALYASPERVYFCGLTLAGPAANVLAHRAPAPVTAA